MNVKRGVTVHSPVRTRRLGQTALLAGSLAFGLATIVALPVAAECDGPALSFRQYAPTAPMVVIGDVSAIDADGVVPDDGDPGRSRVFTLAVRYVVRGTAGDTLEVANLASGPCSGPVTVRVGERLAIAFRVTSPSWDAPSNAVAWLRGTPPRLPGIEQLTVAQVFTTLGLVPPPTSTAAPASTTVPIGLLFAVGLAVLVIVASRPAPRGGPR
jgi:hypothetical protein